MRIHITLSGPLLALLMGFLQMQARAQDSLFYANGNVVLGQVEEIGLDLIRYRTGSEGNAVLIVVDKHELSRIRLRGGQEYVFSTAVGEEGLSPAFLTRKHVLALDVISPALNHITVQYQQALGKRVGLAVKAGYIGPWELDRSDDVYNSRGGLLTAGVTFTLPYATKRIPSVRDTHPLAGWYLRPEIVLSTWSRRWYSYNYIYEPVERKYYYTSAGLMLTIGRQVLLGERFTFDMSAGFGYGTQWQNGKVMDGGEYPYDRQNYAFSHAFLGGVGPLIVSGGLRFGYVF